MRTLIRLISPIVLALIVVATLLAVGGRITATAHYVDGGVLVQWSSSDESGVKRFDILRAQVIRDGVSDFRVVGSLDPQGSGKSYQFIDREAFKSTGSVFAYKVRQVYLDDSFVDSDQVKTQVASSTAKRTWGSIKALFR